MSTTDTHVLFGDVLDELLAHHPDAATALGDHRHDDRLADLSPEGVADELAWVRRRREDLSELDGDLSLDDAVDAAILRNRLDSREHELTTLREHEWDPLAWNPGTAVYLLLARDFAPLGDRLRSAASRLAAVPQVLETARRTLTDMPRVHVETAIGQFTGTRTLLATELERALGEHPAGRREVEPARDAAVTALDEHIAWLRSRLDDANRDPRIGAQAFARKLALTLDTDSDSDAVLSRAECDLATIEDELAVAAARLDPQGDRHGQVRRVLDRLAAEGHVDNATIVGHCEQALAATTDFVRSTRLVTVPDDPVEIIVMPEIHRGVAVAYCDPPGPLESASLPTFFAVAPTPEDWPKAQVDSFYREYNAHMLHNLTVHEAMPGHVLQLAHSARFEAAVPVRKALWSGTFVEGWAVHAEALMVERGYRADEGQLEALRMQQLKMALRSTINAILDARVHAHGMTEAEAMTLMTERGHQEEGEAAGKWRRALLTSTQLSTYYVGHLEVSGIARDLAAAHPELDEQARHDAMLSFGSPAPRHLRTLLHL
ncbi:MAG: hypothetical protein QOJ60_1865 [Actinomycetota bacterium]|jgi:uncharacterized protein (DUF885 family)|nr:hypothetical protein [Actinomycetota bacterium]